MCRSVVEEACQYLAHKWLQPSTLARMQRPCKLMEPRMYPEALKQVLTARVRAFAAPQYSIIRPVCS